MKRIWMMLALLAACQSKPTKHEEAAAIDEYIQTYLAADWEAERTKTHASGDHPTAIRKRDFAEMKVVSAGEDPVHGLTVRQAIAKKKQELESREQELTSERNSILVAGRAHTDMDQKRLEEIAAKLREIEFMKGSLATLSSRLRPR
jgi:hypothetical protein